MSTDILYFKDYRYSGFVDNKTGDIYYKVISPKYKRTLHTLHAHITDKVDFNNKDLMELINRVLNK